MGLSVTGGVVNHATSPPELDGAYIFADFATGIVVALREANPLWKDEILMREPGISAIGVDPQNGDLLFANLAQGKIKRLTRAPVVPVSAQ